MKITAVHLASTRGGFFHEDQLAIRSGAERDGDHYPGAPATPGFVAIRQHASALSIGLELADRTILWGEGASVQYAGAAGRDEVFDADAWMAKHGERCRTALTGVEVSWFRAADRLVQHRLREIGAAHTAASYAVSQALLGASAASRRRSMTEVLCEEYGLELHVAPIPIYAQSGDDRRQAVDRMVLKRVDVLPHGLINNHDKFGHRGRRFLEYVRWVAERIAVVGHGDYRPMLHFDVYGLPGRELGLSTEALVPFLAEVQAAAEPFDVRVESPADFGSRAAQIAGFVALREELERHGLGVQIVADEWCNTLDDVRRFADARAGHMLQVKVPDLGSLDQTVEAVLGCHSAGIGVVLGGSCTETDISARVCAHIALATRPAYQLAKPGMGVDEGVMIVSNEQARTLARLGAATRSQDG